MQKHEYSPPFLKPVDHVALDIPDYPLIIKEPMDLSKVEKKLRSGLYANPMQFATDMRKIWANAILYNPKSTAIHSMTLVIRDFFEKIYKPVEENPFTDTENDFIHAKVAKVDKRLEELKAPNHDDWQELLEKQITQEEMANIIQTIEGNYRSYLSYEARVPV